MDVDGRSEERGRGIHVTLALRVRAGVEEERKDIRSRSKRFMLREGKQCRASLVLGAF
jgi:hypothetical protein